MFASSHLLAPLVSLLLNPQQLLIIANIRGLVVVVHRDKVVIAHQLYLIHMQFNVVILH